MVIYNKGPIIEPCGTPHVTGDAVESDHLSRIGTISRLFDQHDSWKVFHGRLCQMLS